AAANGVVVLLPAQAEDFDFAGSGFEESLGDFEGGGLAGAVGAEQAEAFAALDVEIEAADRFDGRLAGEGLGQVATADGRGHGEHCTIRSLPASGGVLGCGLGHSPTYGRICRSGCARQSSTPTMVSAPFTP